MGFKSKRTLSALSIWKKRKHEGDNKIGAGVSSEENRQKKENEQPIFPSEEIIIKDEPIEDSRDDETTPALLENGQDPMPLNIPYLLPTIKQLPSGKRCNFCLTALLDETVSLAAYRTVMFREQIEYVLSTNMQTLNMYCCPSCWRMFDLFYNFKKSCLMVLSSAEQILASIPPAVEIVSEIKYPVNNSDPEIPTSRQPTYQQQSLDQRYHRDMHFTTHLVNNDAPELLSNCSALQDRPTQSAEKNDHILDPSNVEKPPNEDNTQWNPDEREDADWWCKDTEELPPADEYICSWCEIKFPAEENLKRHRRSCHVRAKQIAKIPKKCFICSEVFHNRADLNVHFLQHKEAGITGYPCRKQGCGKILGTLGSRQSHETQHRKPDKHVCNVCGVVFKQSGSLNYHIASHGEPRFACDKCDKAFYNPRSLKKHASVHSDARNFECKVCGKRFKSSEANRVHQRIHTMEKPYACVICGEKFTYNCLLKAHLQKGHLPPDSDSCAD